MDYQLQTAALRAALDASTRLPFHPQRRQDVLDALTVVTDAIHRNGALVEYAIIMIRQIVQAYPDAGVSEEEAIKHVIVQFYR